MNPQGATDMEAVVRFLDRVVREEDGQDMVEYALLVAFIALVALVGVKVTGTGIKTMFTNLGNAISGIATTL